MLCKKVGGTKIPRNESSEQKVHALSRGTKVPGNAWSREQTFSIGTIRSWEWKVWGTKSPGTPVSSNDVPKWYFTYQSRIRNSMYRNWYHMYRRYRWLWLILVDHFSILCCTFCGWLCSSHCPHGVGLLRAVTLYPVMGFMGNCPNLLYKKITFQWYQTQNERSLFASKQNWQWQATSVGRGPSKLISKKNTVNQETN